MVTMAICWKAILAMIEAIFIIGLFPFSLVMATSDKKWVKITGEAIIGLYVIGFLVGVYFAISKTMC